jgi:hypothetical protein
MSAAVLVPFEAFSVEAKARVMRAIAALAALLCSLTLWFFVRDQRRGSAVLAAFALSPAIVLQTANGAHNDIFALLFGLVTAVFIKREHYLAGAVTFALSTAIKFTLAPFLAPIIALVLIRRGITRAAVALTLFALVPMALALPYGLQRSLLQPLEDVRTFNPPVLVVIAGRAFSHVRGFHASVSQLGAIYVSVVLACALALVFFTLRRQRLPVVEAGMLLLIFCAAHFEPWYAIMLVPIVIVPATWAVPLFAGVSLASQVFEVNVFIGNYNNLPIGQFFMLAGIAFVATAIYIIGPKCLIHCIRQFNASRGAV